MIVVVLAYIFWAKPEPGAVTGILYTPENSSINSSAIIDGQVIKEGDTIYGVKVVKIHRTKVEFEKNRKRWQQGVRQRPNPAWQESD